MHHDQLLCYNDWIIYWLKDGFCGAYKEKGARSFFLGGGEYVASGADLGSTE